MQAANVKAEGYEEEQDLVMLHGPDEAGQGHEEEEHAHTDDASHHLKTGDQTKPLPPRSNANHQQAHHLHHRHTGWNSESKSCGQILRFLY